MFRPGTALWFYGPLEPTARGSLLDRVLLALLSLQASGWDVLASDDVDQAPVLETRLRRTSKSGMKCGLGDSYSVIKISTPLPPLQVSIHALYQQD